MLLVDAHPLDPWLELVPEENAIAANNLLDQIDRDAAAEYEQAHGLEPGTESQRGHFMLFSECAKLFQAEGAGNWVNEHECMDKFTVLHHAHEFKISRIKSLPLELAHLRNAKHDGNDDRRAT